MSDARRAASLKSISTTSKSESSKLRNGNLRGRRRLLAPVSRSQAAVKGPGGTLENPTINKNRPKSTRIRVRLDESYQIDNLEDNGLSNNHNELPEEIQSLENETRKRRQSPLTESNTKYQRYYSQVQTEIKGQKHTIPVLKAIENTYGESAVQEIFDTLGIVRPEDLKTLTREERSQIIVKVTEDLFNGDGIFNDRNLFPQATLNAVEDATVALDTRSRIGAAFSDLYLHKGKQFFITNYPLTPTGLNRFEITMGGQRIEINHQTYAITQIARGS